MPKKIKTIFVVSTIHLSTKEIAGKSYEFPHARAVGWFSNEAAAKKIIIENHGNIYEVGHYPFAVIEETEEWLYPDIVKEIWFKWDNKKEKYIEVNKPRRFKKYIGFGIS